MRVDNQTMQLHKDTVHVSISFATFSLFFCFNSIQLKILYLLRVNNISLQKTFSHMALKFKFIDLPSLNDNDDPFCYWCNVEDSNGVLMSVGTDSGN